MSEIMLPVNVLDYPHWRVNFRPLHYNEELIPSISECLNIVRKSKLSLRGWDYPHISREDQLGYGNNSIDSWVDFSGHIEYWRFYQSGQYIHLFAVKEEANLGFKEHVKSNLISMDWTKIPGFISILNFIYSMTEIFEFAARLCERSVYEGSLTIDIQLRGIKGFILLYTDWDREVDNLYQTGSDILGHAWSVDTDVLIADSSNQSLNAISWFFERFGWLSQPREVFKKDQENLLKGNY